MNTQAKTILILAGEASGDLLGSQLALELLKQNPNLKLIGMGGSKMAAAGVDIAVNSDDLAVVGALEILKHLGKIRAAFKVIKNILRNNPPDLIIPIDYPGFNLRIAKTAKKAGIKVLYYVSPQIWAWRYSRIKHIKKYIDRMAVLFSFEEKMYQKENMPVSFVGHPIIDIAKASNSKEQTYARYQLDPTRPVIALLPGSRHSEITRLLSVIMQSCELIRKQQPNVQFVLPLASSITLDEIKVHCTENITLVENDTYNILNIADAAITASGTATLEIALLEVPMSIIYKVNFLTYEVGRRILTVDHIGLCNLVAEQEVAREFIQHTVTPESIAAETLKLLNDQDYRSAVLNKLQVVKQNLGQSGGSERVATVATSML